MSSTRTQTPRPAPPPPPPKQTGTAGAPPPAKGPDAKQQALATLKKWLSGKENLLATMCGGKEAAARFGQAVLLTAVRSPSLLSCDLKSLFLAALWCAQRGLEPGVADGCAMVPYKGKVTPIPQYQGIIKQAVQHESAKKVRAKLIYANDFYEWEEGENPRFVHKPAPLGTERGNIIGAYAVITLPDGEKVTHVMPLDDIYKIRAASAAWRDGQQGPWKDWEEPMILKTVTKQAFKFIPVAPKVRDLLEQDSKLEAGAPIEDVMDAEILEVTEVADSQGQEGQPQSRAAQMAEELKQKTGAQDVPPPSPPPPPEPPPGDMEAPPPSSETTAAPPEPPSGKAPAPGTDSDAVSGPEAPQAGAETQLAPPAEEDLAAISRKVHLLFDQAVEKQIVGQVMSKFSLQKWEDLVDRPDLVPLVESFIQQSQAPPPPKGRQKSA
ncbi:MAG: recombinase RecT [Thermodesulfobacteriota bacterium]